MSNKDIIELAFIRYQNAVGSYKKKNAVGYSRKRPNLKFLFRWWFSLLLLWFEFSPKQTNKIKIKIKIEIKIRIKMGSQVKLYGHNTAAALSLSFHFPLPPRVRTLLAFPKPQRLVVLAMAVKRSPKRLKYSSPRFTKVFLSLPPCKDFVWLPRNWCQRMRKLQFRFAQIFLLLLLFLLPFFFSH